MAWVFDGAGRTPEDDYGAEPEEETDPAAVHRCSVCGEEFDLLAWWSLEFKGRSDVDRSRWSWLEMRQCICGNTLAEPFTREGK